MLFTCDPNQPDQRNLSNKINKNKNKNKIIKIKNKKIKK